MPLKRAFLELRKSLRQCVSTQMCKSVSELLSIFGADLTRCLLAPVSCVKLVRNLHDRNASDNVTSKDRTLNWSGSSPARQQRRVNIQSTVRSKRDYLIWQNTAKSNHTEHFWLYLLHGRNYFWSHAVCLKNGQSKLLCAFFYGRRLKRFPTTTNSIWPCNNQSNLVIMGKFFERWNSKVWSSHKDYAHVNS